MSSFSLGHRKLSLPNHRKLISGNKEVVKENLNVSGRNPNCSLVESMVGNQVITSSHNPRRNGQSTSSSSLSHLISRTTSPCIAENNFVVNRKITKGYAKFLEENEFIERRKEARQKVQEDVKHFFAKENPKIISEDIQQLVASTIINDPIRRLRTVLQPSNTNIINGEQNQNNYDEKHRQICNRILGNNFENNQLFVKTQKERNTNIQISKRKNCSSMPLIQSSNSLLIRRKPFSIQCIQDTKNENIQTNTTDNEGNGPKSLLEITTLDFLKEKEEQSKINQFFSHEGKSTIPSLQHLDNETSKENEDMDILSTLKSKLFLTSQTSKTRHNKFFTVQKASRFLLENFNSCEANENIHKSPKTKFLIKNKTPKNNEVFQANLQKNKRKVLNIRKKKIKSHSTSQENLSGTVVGLSSRDLNKPPLDVIEKINQLCHGVLQSSNKLGGKIQKEYRKTGREFSRLDIQMEKLKYENTILNWEKSLKQAENMTYKKETS